MKVIKNKLIPFGNYYAINVFGYVFTKRNLKDWELRHEEIHSEQMRELFYLPFYLWYCLEFLIKLPFYKFNWEKAYKAISFEREAYFYQDWLYYISYRKKFAWWQYIKKVGSTYSLF